MIESKRPINHRAYFKRGIEGEYITYCPTCKEQVICKELLECFYDTVGTYIGCGVLCSKGHRVFAINRKASPIVIKSTFTSRPMTRNDVANWQMRLQVLYED